MLQLDFVEDKSTILEEASLAKDAVAVPVVSN
jgi:hypothetical protein